MGLNIHVVWFAVPVENTDGQFKLDLHFSHCLNALLSSMKYNSFRSLTWGILSYFSYQYVFIYLRVSVLKNPNCFVYNLVLGESNVCDRGKIIFKIHEIYLKEIITIHQNRNTERCLLARFQNERKESRWPMLHCTCTFSRNMQ